MNIEKEALQAITMEFDRFISACIDSDGKPVAPKRGELMAAKACLPKYCKNSFKKQETK